MKLLMLMADGFEDVEAIATKDVLTRGKDEVIMASMMSSLEVKTKTGHGFVCNDMIRNLDFSSFDGLIIPGGPASFKILDKMDIVNDLIKDFVGRKKLVAAICAAPFLIGRLGYFKGLKYTVHPGFEQFIVDGIYCRENGVVVTNNFITAKSMYYSIPFGLAIHEYFHGKESRDALERSCMGE